MEICNLPGLRHLGFCQKKHGHHYKPLTEYLVMITRVALGIMAAMTSLVLFVPGLVIGIGIGMYHHHYPPKHHDHFHDDPFSINGCGQFMQTIANMDFPPEMSLTANFAITVCHLDHHPYVFVPYCAMALGMWLGQRIDQVLDHTFTWYAPKEKKLFGPEFWV